MTRRTAWVSATGAMASALAMLACCLPWGFAAALGATGAGLFFSRYRAVFLVLAPAFLAFGFWQHYSARRCDIRTGRISGILLWVATVVVLVVILFPQWIASFIAGGAK